MPSYQVKSQGFYHGRLYGPGTKRPVLTVENPFTAKSGKNPKPSWIGEEVKTPEPEVVDETPKTETLTDDEVKVADVTQTTGEGDPVDPNADFSGSSDIKNSEDAQPSKPASTNVETL